MRVAFFLHKEKKLTGMKRAVTMGLMSLIDVSARPNNVSPNLEEAHASDRLTVEMYAKVSSYDKFASLRSYDLGL